MQTLMNIAAYANPGAEFSSSERFAKRLHLLASYSAIGIVRYKIPIRSHRTVTVSRLIGS